MRPDFPAAHSMDTLWFAVDKEGHVAMFASGEAGAVPVDGYLGEEWGATLEGLQKLPKVADGTPSEDPEGYEAVLDHGVYLYGHEKTENILSGPYTQMKPVKPIKIDQLPYTVREVVERVKFENLSFGTTKELQPIDYAKCEAWGAAYLADTAGTVKPIPGKEVEYAEEYAQFSADLPEYKWEPPASPVPRKAQAAPRIVRRQSKRSLILLIACAAVFMALLLLIQWLAGRF